MIVYFKDSGLIVRKLPPSQDIETHYHHYPQEFKDRIDCLMLDEYPSSLSNYIVKNGNLVELSESEFIEVRSYGRILTEQERYEILLMSNLKPTNEEVQKAENTIEILSLLMEVL